MMFIYFQFFSLTSSVSLGIAPNVTKQHILTIILSLTFLVVIILFWCLCIINTLTLLKLQLYSGQEQHSRTCNNSKKHIKPMTAAVNKEHNNLLLASCQLPSLIHSGLLGK